MELLKQQKEEEKRKKRELAKLEKQKEKIAGTETKLQDLVSTLNDHITCVMDV